MWICWSIVNPDPRRAVVGVDEPAVNRDPLAEERGSMTISHTSAGGAAIAIEAVTRLIDRARAGGDR